MNEDAEGEWITKNEKGNKKRNERRRIKNGCNTRRDQKHIIHPKKMFINVERQSIIDAYSYVFHVLSFRFGRLFFVLQTENLNLIRARALVIFPRGMWGGGGFGE